MKFPFNQRVRSNKDCGFKSIQWSCAAQECVCVCVYVLLQGESCCSGMAQKCVYVYCCQDPIRTQSRTPESSSKLHYTLYYTTLQCNTQLYYTIHCTTLRYIILDSFLDNILYYNVLHNSSFLHITVHNST